MTTMKKMVIIISAVTAGCLIIPCLLYVAGLFIAHKGNPDFLKVDACLDSGGAWDYTNRSCIFSNNPISGR
jgi:hypothetical protein